MNYKVFKLRQVDGGTRYIALLRDEARAVLRDRTLIERVTPGAVLDVDRYGRETWQRPFGCLDCAAARTAIREYWRGHLWLDAETAW